MVLFRCRSRYLCRITKLLWNNTVAPIARVLNSTIFRKFPLCLSFMDRLLVELLSIFKCKELVWEASRTWPCTRTPVFNSKFANTISRGAWLWLYPSSGLLLIWVRYLVASDTELRAERPLKPSVHMMAQSERARYTRHERQRCFILYVCVATAATSCTSSISLHFPGQGLLSCSVKEQELTCANVKRLLLSSISVHAIVQLSYLLLSYKK